jgi:microcystin degradation protein MlrC
LSIQGSTSRGFKMAMDTTRIAIGGIGHETNTFSPVWTDYDDFRFTRGSAILDERLGRFQQAEGFELLPTVVAGALPSGLIRKAAYLRIRDGLLHELEAAIPLDGVYLDLHGAMEVEDIGDGESDLISAVRTLVGPDALISVSLDLHGNISPILVETADILTAYRTAPHRDALATRQRAMGLLIQALQEKMRPVAALIKPPLLLAGESAVTEVEPARSLYARLAEIERDPGVLDASLLVGCAWTDSPYTSTSVIVVARQDNQLAKQYAVDLAQQVWRARQEFRFGVETATVDESIRRAIDAVEHPVFISDSGDNVTAGGAGDVPLFAKRLVALGARDALVAGLTDAAAVIECAMAGVGATVQLSIGGKLDRTSADAFKVTACVEHLTAETGPHGAEPDTAVVRVEGVRIALTRDRRFLADRAIIAATGVDPMAQKIVVVKLGYLFPDLYDHAPRVIMALSPGATDLRLEELPYCHLQHPIFPLDAGFHWAPP